MERAEQLVITPREDARAAPATSIVGEPGLTWRSGLLAVVLTIMCGWWVRQAEIVVLSTQISESIPAIPALAALVFLLPVNALLRRLSRRLPALRPLSRAELLNKAELPRGAERPR